MTSTTKVHKVTVEKINRGKNLGGFGYGVFVYATRNGQELRTCIETSGILEDMNARATSHAKKWKALAEIL